MAVVLAVVAAFGVGLIAFPASSTAEPPKVPPVGVPCTPALPPPSKGCVNLSVTGLVAPAGIGAAFERARVGFRFAVKLASGDELNTMQVRFEDDIAFNLAAIPACPASELTGMNMAQAWEQCGPGADGSPPSEGNAYLSTGLGANVSGRASTVPPGNLSACTMVFKGATNNQLTLYVRIPVSSSITGCNAPATNTGGVGTYLFTGTLSHQPVASPHDWTLTAPNIQTANPPLDEFYATLDRPAPVGTFRARCVASTPPPVPASPHRLQGRFTFGVPPIFIANATDPCP